MRKNIKFLINNFILKKICFKKRGGKGLAKEKIFEKEKIPSKITVQRAPRGKTKSVTVIKGLNTFGKLFFNNK